MVSLAVLAKISSIVDMIEWMLILSIAAATTNIYHRRSDSGVAVKPNLT
jgi:hypothetical protein